MGGEGRERTMTEAIEPVRKAVRVPVRRRAAFHRFTAEIETWWPRSTHSVSGEECSGVVMEERSGGRVYEVADDGREIEWGVVTAWDPPERVAFTWHPGRDSGTSQEVEVTFEDAEGGTRVTLVHTGWERLGEGAAEARDQYVGGWDQVLGLYVKVVAGG